MLIYGVYTPFWSLYDLFFKQEQEKQYLLLGFKDKNNTTTISSSW